jgi:hypothetical protein
MTTRRLLTLAASGSLLAATPAAAQSVSDVLTFLLTNQSVATGSPASDRSAAQSTSDTISRAVRVNLATLPVPTSAGAFTFRLNPQLGTVEQVTRTFGPSFVDRAQTIDAGQAAFRVAFQSLRFSSLDGRNLRDGSFVTTANQFVDEATPFDADQLTLDIDASVMTLSGTFGIAEGIELAVAAPIVSLRVDGSRVNIYRGRAFTQATASAHAFGLADVDIRAKVMLAGDDASGVTAAVDARVPTGREQDLLGAGSLSVKFSGIGSIERGPVSTHANAALSVGGVARELSLNGAVGVAASRRVTIMTELLGRWIDSPGHILPVSAPNPAIPGVETVRLMSGPTSLTTLTIVPGLKWNVSDTWVIGGSFSILLTSSGLTGPLSPFVGLDYLLGH